MIRALADVLPPFLMVVGFFALLGAATWLLARCMDVPEPPATRRHPSLFSTHQIRDSFPNFEGEWTIVCFCGERISGLADQDEVNRVMCFHQAEQDAHETRTVGRFR